MPKLLKIVLALLIAYLIVGGGVGLIVNSAISGLAQGGMQGWLQQQIPVDVRIESGGLDLVEWLLLRPALELKGVTVENPPGYSEDQPMLRVNSVSVRVGLFALLNKRVEVRSLVIDGLRARVERNAEGKTNFETLIEALRGSEKADGVEQPEGEGAEIEVAIDRFELRDGAIEFAPADEGGEPFRIAPVRIRLTGFSADSTSDLLLEAAAFDSGVRVRLAGRAGPFSRGSIPAEGELEVDVEPARVPVSLRVETFGNVFRDPGPDSRIRFAASVSGELLDALAGEGSIKIDNLLLGRDAEHRLALGGEAPLKIAARNPLGDYELDLEISDASFSLGKGEWRGGAELHYRRPSFRGSSAGAIRGLDINEILSAFTEKEDVVFGRLALERYRIRFRGENADEMRDSLTGDGRLVIEEGRFAFLDLLSTIDRHLSKALGGEQAAEGETGFTRFSTRFEIRDRRLYTPDLKLESDVTHLTGSGSFGFDGDLDYRLSTLVGGSIAAALGAKAPEGEQPRVAVPVRISGTVENPKARPDLAKLAKDTAVRKASGLLESLFKTK